MTATPRLYAPATKAKAQEKQVKIYSMDEESDYGPEFYRLDFSKALDEKIYWWIIRCLFLQWMKLM